MSQVVLTDINGASIGVNPALVAKITDAGTTPQGALVRTVSGEAFVLAGTVAAAATAIGASFFLVTTDITGAPVAIGLYQVDGLDVSGTTPAGVNVRTGAYTTVLGGALATVAAALVTPTPASTADVAAALATAEAFTTSSIAALNLSSGEWTATPTVTAGGTIVTAVTTFPWLQTRNGGVAMVSGQLNLTVSGAGSATIQVAGLPYHNADYAGYFVTTSTDTTKAYAFPGSVHNNNLTLNVTCLAAAATVSIFVVCQYNIS